jgi:hypothetical protein
MSEFKRMTITKEFIKGAYPEFVIAKLLDFLGNSNEVDLVVTVDLRRERD